MTDFEKNCYGMSEEEIRRVYLSSRTSSRIGVEMVVASILSDCQEMLARGGDSERVRKHMNIAKFILFESQGE